jgi:glycine/D-amino acid oxidase-like deaminating enzyme
VDAEEREDLREEVEALWAGGLAAEWVDEPGGPLAGRFTAAIRHPTDAALQPARLVRRLAARAVEAGAELVEGRRIADRSELGADVVVIATDGYPSGLLGELEGLIVPTRGQVIATEPLAERLFETPHYGRHGFDYWHQTEDGRLVAGGFRDVSLEEEFTADEALTDTVQRALSSFVNELVGRELRVDYRWAGIFGLVLDFLPVVGEVPGAPGTWVAGGYSGHGNVLGFACGRLLARAILGDRDPLLDLFQPARLLG